ncbi:MAG: hypothetical protein HY438_04375 [DPANN group archaeon]|nr:hypothetical protein [DPANN group archaeon]
MAFFFKKKKEDELLDLPPLPPLPEDEGMEQQGFPMDEEESQGMPPLPPMQAPPAMPPPQMPRFQKPMGIPETATVFVKIDKYKEIMQMVDSMNTKLEDLRHNLDKISAIKQRESEIIQGWNAMLSESKTKIDELNRKLLRPGEA